MQRRDRKQDDAGLDQAVTAARNQRASSGVDPLVEVLSRVLVRRALIELQVVAASGPAAPPAPSDHRRLPREGAAKNRAEQTDAAG